MGVDICHYVDHDLPTDNIEAFVREFKKRVKSDNVVIQTEEEFCYDFDDIHDNIWYVYQENQETILVHYNDEFVFYVYKKSLDVFNVRIEGETDCTRWYMMIRSFESDPEYAKIWIDETIGFMKQIVVPIFHSKKMMLLADSSSLRHDYMENYLIDNGKSIDEALELNKTFNPPCKVYWNYDAIEINENDYFDGDIGPIFMFDLIDV